MSKKRKKRYKSAPKLKPFRLVIVAEGSKTEPNYFEALEEWVAEEAFQIIMVPHLKKTDSAPKHFLERYEKALKRNIDKIQKTDFVYFICDVDDYIPQLNKLENQLSGLTDKELLISNPCFEIWLLAHVSNKKFDSQTCADLKSMKNDMGADNYTILIGKFNVATRNAKHNYTSNNRTFPKKGETTLFQLGEKVQAFLANRP